MMVAVQTVIVAVALVAWVLWAVWFFKKDIDPEDYPR